MGGVFWSFIVNNSIIVWDLEQKQSVFTMNQHSKPISSLAAVTEGNIEFLASGSYDNTIINYEASENSSHTLEYLIK